MNEHFGHSKKEPKGDEKLVFKSFFEIFKNSYLIKQLNSGLAKLELIAIYLRLKPIME